MGPAALEETGDRGMDSFQRKRQSSRSASRNRLRHQAARGERRSQRAEGGAARPGLDQPVGQWEGGKTDGNASPALGKQLSYRRDNARLAHILRGL